MRSWGWALQYGVAIFLAVLAGAVLGSNPLFKGTALGGGLTASHVVQFLGYGGALLVLWFLACRAAMEIPEDAKGLSFLRRLVVPLATLIVLSAGYKVLLLLLTPFLKKTAITVYNWIFVLGIIGAVFWLILRSYRTSVLLVDTLAPLGPAGQPAAPSAPGSCLLCGAPVVPAMKSCSRCGQRLDSATCRNCGAPLVLGQKFCGDCGTSVGRVEESWRRIESDETKLREA